MASKILSTKRTVVPTLVPLDGFDESKLVRSDPTTHFVDVIQAFSLVLGEDNGKRTVHVLLKSIDGKGDFHSPIDNESIDLSKFSRCRWKGTPGRESIIAPLHVVVQMLLLHPSTKTKAILESTVQTALRVASGDRTIVPQVESNATRLDGTETQLVMQADLPAPSPLPNNGDRSFMLIGMMSDGEAKTSMIMRELEAEREARKSREEREWEDRRAMEEERHKNQLVVYNEQIAAIRRESHQKDMVYKKQLDEYNEDKKRRMIQELQYQIEHARDESTRCVLEEKLEMLHKIPTETTFLVHTDKIERPQRLQQQVLVNEGSALEYRFPAGTTLLDANLESRVTVREYVDRVYPSAKLSNDDFKRLGGLVAKAVEAHNPGAANLVMKKSVDGEKYAPRVYFMRDLDGPPLDSIIEEFVKSNGVVGSSSGTAVTTGGKRKGSTGSLDAWVKRPAIAIGTPIP